MKIPTINTKTQQWQDMIAAAEAQKKADTEAEKAALEEKKEEVEQTPITTESTAASTEGAAPQMQEYDEFTQQALGESPEEAMKKAQAAAGQLAQQQTDLATMNAVRAARTAGVMPGQAALGAQQQAANAYGQAQQAAQQQYFNIAQLGATLGSEMSNRLAQAGQVEAGLKQTAMSNLSAEEQARLNAETQSAIARQADKTARRGQNIGLIGQGIGALGGLAGIFSDKNLKENFGGTNLSEGLDALKSFTYNYKGSQKPESGIMAQDLEKTNMAPAVVETPKGKMLDTNRLTAMNTGALGEHEGRIKNIEKLLAGLKEVDRAKNGRN